MKKIISLLVFLFFIAGCGKKDGTSSTNTKKYSCNSLNVFNWGEYIGKNVNENFEKEFGVKINYSLFDSNEGMYNKLLGGTKYDVLVPSDYMTERLIKEKLVSKLDKSKIPNISELYDNIPNREADPENDYSVPYFWGSVGIVYDSRIVDENDIQNKGWSILKDEKYKGKIYMYDSERDSFMAAFKALGYSMNTDDIKQIEEAYNWLIDLHIKMTPAYVTDEAIDGLINGEKAMGIMYSGDAAYILSENENMRFYQPKEGTNYWTDTMVIPEVSQCKDLAHEYINYILSYDAAYDNSVTIGYSSVNKKVFEQLVKNEFKDNKAYNPVEMSEKDEIFRHNEVLREKLSELWIKVKNK